MLKRNESETYGALVGDQFQGGPGNIVQVGEQEEEWS